MRKYPPGSEMSDASFQNPASPRRSGSDDDVLAVCRADVLTVCCAGPAAAPPGHVDHDVAIASSGSAIVAARTGLLTRAIVIGALRCEDSFGHQRAVTTICVPVRPARSRRCRASSA